VPSSRKLVIAAYLTCAAVWGTTWFGIRVCIGPGGYPTFEAAAIRFTIASAILIPMVLISGIGPRPRGSQWSWLILAGVLDAVGYALVYLGEEKIPGGLAAVLFGTQPLILAVLSTASRTERIHLGDVAGALVSLAGVAIISLDRLDVSTHQALGVGMVLGSVVASTIYSMIMKRHAGATHALVVTTVFLTVTAVCLWIAVLVRGIAPLPWPPPIAPTVALFYLAVMGSVVAFATYFWLLVRVSLMTTSTLVFVMPLIALIVDAGFEDKVHLNGRAYLGIAVTLAGLVVSVLLRARAGQR
jgi:drug/metabolite transporter (DMT)-like permease